MWFVSKKRFQEVSAQLCEAIRANEMLEIEKKLLIEKHKEELGDYKDMIDQNNGMKLRIMSLTQELASCQSQLEILKTR